MDSLIILLLIANMALSALLLVVLPKKTKFSIGRSSSRKVILDSCALIDGRIVELAEAGFTPEEIIVPAFIIRELQMLADGGDSQKRERARYGLDIANKLKELKAVNVVINRSEPGATTTDDKLIELSRNINARLYTTDFNLAKVATVEGIKVLNVNELAQKLKPNMLPGEKLSLKVVQRGSSRGQGVGYTDDGTMVVIDQADKLIGTSVEVIIDRMIGTMAGKMIFAKLQGPTSKPRRPQKGTQIKRDRNNDDQRYVQDLYKELELK